MYSYCFDIEEIIIIEAFALLRFNNLLFAWAAFGCVCTTEECAASGGVNTTGAWAASGRVCTTEVCV